MNIRIIFLFFTPIFCQIPTDTQTSCFKQFPIYRSNSPHQIEKQGNQICVTHEKYINTDELISQPIKSSSQTRSINPDNSISLPSTTPVNLTVYQAGTSVFKYLNSTGRAFFYRLPVSLFNDRRCSGSQAITYMNDFTSTCDQIVTQSRCTVELNPSTYADGLYLITDPKSLANVTPSFVQCAGTFSLSSWSTPTCSGALQRFDLNIYYENPTGITGCNFTVTPAAATADETFIQTFSIRFLKRNTAASTLTRSGNPGYLHRSLIKTANLVGNTYNPTSGLAVLQIGSANGVCSTGSTRYIRFGENLQSTCLYSQCLNVTNFSDFLGLTNVPNLYASIYGNPDVMSDPWQRPSFCTSTTGSTESATCSKDSIPSPATSQCFTRVDIQIIYANLGSVTNPQAILSSVIYHFQSSPRTSTTDQIITQTVSFEEISNPPSTQDDLIPRPNTRLPGDFFYPFSLNHSSRMTLVSSIFYLFLFSVFFIF